MVQSLIPVCLSALYKRSVLLLRTTEAPGQMLSSECLWMWQKTAGLDTTNKCNTYKHSELRIFCRDSAQGTGHITNRSCFVPAEETHKPTVISEELCKRKFLILINNRLILRGKAILFLQPLKIVHVEDFSHEQLRKTELLTTLGLNIPKVITHNLESCPYTQSAIHNS